ncbi:MAG: hypothetical protein AAF590_05675 [Pseudomonadota bacterium]
MSNDSYKIGKTLSEQRDLDIVDALEAGYLATITAMDVFEETENG